MRRIALLVPDMPSREEIDKYLVRIDSRRWYSNFGPLVAELEERLASFFRESSKVDAKVVSIANATLGLELALIASNLPSRARVLVPALTFVASAASIVRAGFVPVICDVDADGWLLTPEIAIQLVEELDIDAVMPVTTYGCPQDADAWGHFETQTGIPVLLDAAGAFGNQIITRSQIAVFSLHATKALGAGEGGFAITTNASAIAQMRTLTNFGIDLVDGLVHAVGTNAKLSEYHAAVALAALDGWKSRVARRVELHQRYLATLMRYCPSVEFQKRPENGAYSILPVLLPENTYAEVASKKLAENGIETRRWYCPTIERHPAYRNYPVASHLQVSAMLNERLLALPFHIFLSEYDIESVCRNLAQVIGEA